MYNKALWLSLLLIASANATEIRSTIARLSHTSSAERENAIGELCKGGSAVTAALISAETDAPRSAQELQTLHRIIANNQFSDKRLPLVDADSLTVLKLRKTGEPIRFDRAKRVIAIPATFKLRHGELEYLVVDSSPSAPVHETLLAAGVKPSDLCVALLACGYSTLERLSESGPLELPASACAKLSIQWHFERPHAGMISDNPDERHAIREADAKFVTTIRVPIEVFVHNSATKRAMRCAPFVFTGSEFVKNTATDRVGLAADAEGPIVALKYNPSAVLNTALNTRNIDPQRSPGYQINRFTVPDCGTKCLLIIEPCSEQIFSEADLNDKASEKTADVP